MTHDELLHTISADYAHNKAIQALYAVVELHKPVQEGIGMELSIKNGEPTYTDLFETRCSGCQNGRYRYPCPTIQAIEKELQ